MNNLSPIRDFCNNNSTAREWMQSCLSEVINEAVKAKDYAAVAATSELMLQVVPDQRLVPQPQLAETVTPEVLSPDQQGEQGVTSWAAPATRALMETKVLEFLKDYRRFHGSEYAGATTIIDEIERPYMLSGQWQRLPTHLDNSAPHYNRVAKPWRMMINSVLYELSCRQVLEKKHRNYRLATQRKAQ